MMFIKFLAFLFPAKRFWRVFSPFFSPPYLSLSLSFAPLSLSTANILNRCCSKEFAALKFHKKISRKLWTLKLHLKLTFAAYTRPKRKSSSRCCVCNQNLFRVFFRFVLFQHIYTILLEISFYFNEKMKYI